MKSVALTSLTTPTIRANGSAGLRRIRAPIGLVELKYSRRTANFDTGERLRVEYWTGAAWVLIESTTSTAWADRTFVLPASAANNPSFKLRFRTNGNQTVERADVDNVQLTGTP